MTRTNRSDGRDLIRALTCAVRVPSAAPAGGAPNIGAYEGDATTSAYHNPLDFSGGMENIQGDSDVATLLDSAGRISRLTETFGAGGAGVARPLTPKQRPVLRNGDADRRLKVADGDR